MDVETVDNFICFSCVQSYEKLSPKTIIFNY